MTLGVPDVAARTVQANNRRKIVMLMLLAFTVRVVANIETDKKASYPDIKNVIEGVTAANIPAWIVVSVVLLIASDFEAASELAAPFAGLLLIAVLVNDGQDVAKNVDRFVNPPPTKKTKKKKPKDT